MPSKTHKPTLDQVLARNRVTLAIYHLGDDFECQATDAEIAVTAGRSVATARRWLRALEHDGTVAVFFGTGYAPRRIVLLDNIDAKPWIWNIATTHDAVPSVDTQNGCRGADILKWYTEWSLEK